MKALSKLLANTNSTEVYSITDLIIDEFESSGLSTDEHLTGIVNKLKPENNNLREAIARIKTKSKLRQKDSVRDEQYSSTNNLLKGYIHHPEEEIKLAAQNVYKVFGRYNKPIYNKGYATKSSLIGSLLVDLSDADLQNDIDKLSGLRTLVDKLRAANTDFDETWVEYEEHKAAEAQKESATIIAKRVAAIINKQLIVYLRAMLQTDPQQYESFALTVSEIINENNINVKKRSKKKE